MINTHSYFEKYNQGDTVNNTTNHIYLQSSPNKPEFDDWMQKIGTLLQVPTFYKSLKPYIELLAVTFLPERMFLITPILNETSEVSYAQIILTIDQERCSTTELGFFCDLLSFTKTTVLISIYPSTIVEEAIANGHPFFSLKCREDNLVFSGSPYRLAVCNNERLYELKVSLKQYFEGTTDKVVGLINITENLKAENQLELSICQLHQSFKWLFSAIIEAFGGDKPGNGDLIALQQTAERYMPFAANSVSDNTLLQKLNNDYLQNRISNIAEEDIGNLIDAAKDLIQSIGTEVNELTIGHKSE